MPSQNLDELGQWCCKGLHLAPAKLLQGNTLGNHSSAGDPLPRLLPLDKCQVILRCRIDMYINSSGVNGND